MALLLCCGVRPAYDFVQDAPRQFLIVLCIQKNFSLQERWRFS
jgi:hypothetical protein